MRRALAPLLQAFNGPKAHTVELAKRIAACVGIEVTLLAEHAEEVVGFARVQVVQRSVAAFESAADGC